MQCNHFKQTSFKKEATREYYYPCSVRNLSSQKSLCDLGTSINLMPLSIYKKLGLGEARPIKIHLQLADRTIKKLEGILKDVFVRARKFIFPIDFIVLDFEEDEDIPLILGMPFLYTAKEIINVYDGTLTLVVGKESFKLNIYQGMKHSSESDLCFRVDILDKCVIKVQ